SGRGSGGGFALGSEASRAVAAAWVGGDRRVVPAGAGGVQVGQAGGADPEEHGAVAGLEGPASVGAIAGADAAGSSHGRGALGPEGPATLPEGDQELSARLVQVLRIVGPAADEQRLGARLRQPSLPRAPRQWAASCLARIGGDGLGAGDLESGDPAAPGGGLGLAAGLCVALAGAACGPGGAARVATQATTLPP